MLYEKAKAIVLHSSQKGCTYTREFLNLVYIFIYLFIYSFLSYRSNLAETTRLTNKKQRAGTDPARRLPDFETSTTRPREHISRASVTRLRGSSSAQHLTCKGCFSTGAALGRRHRLFPGYVVLGTGINARPYITWISEMDDFTVDDVSVWCCHFFSG
uniref:Uncharacterized protein n=1 Tax=Heterorhabditis bacteriophora TaxID=37862 RepID=A0A1I7WRC9_HETBA